MNNSKKLYLMSSFFLIVCLFITFVFSPQTALAKKDIKDNRPSVLLISIDAMKPELVMESEKYGIELPNLHKYFVKSGTYASEGVESVFPSLTYAAHPSIITGTNPATHGLENNRFFDPTGKHKGAWNWYASDKVPNLWELAKDNGYLSVNAGMPCSVGAKMDYNIVEYWRDSTELDEKLSYALSYPLGIFKELEAAIGDYPNNSWNLASDYKRGQTALWLLDNKIKPEIEQKPFFMTAYFASYDELAHHHLTYSKEALHALEEIDKMVGQLVEKAHKITNNNVVVCVISDHGMVDDIAHIQPNTELYKAGLIKVDANGKVIDYDAIFNQASGMGEIRLKDPNNKEVRAKVEAVLDELIKRPEIMDFYYKGKECSELYGGFADADYVICAELGYQTKSGVTGDFLITDESKWSHIAMHGFHPKFKEMRASFLIEGVGIPQEKDIHFTKLINIAPTLAKIMGFEMPTADGHSILQIIQTNLIY